MDSFEESDHAFIIRIWQESREIEGAQPAWRGVIEHVQSGYRQYLRDLSSITTFILPYLETMGIDTEALQRWTEQYPRPQGRSGQARE